MKVDRSNDAVYRDTMNVVKAVLQTNQETMNGKPDDLFTLVKVRLTEHPDSGLKIRGGWELAHWKNFRRAEPRCTLGGVRNYRCLV